LGIRAGEQEVAFGRPTSQSSTFSQGIDFTSSLAVDGNSNPDMLRPNNAGSCTHTQTEQNPWWKVELASTKTVATVKVWRRGDCCAERLAGFQVWVGNTAGTYNGAGNQQCDSPAAFIAGSTRRLLASGRRLMGSSGYRQPQGSTSTVNCRNKNGRYVFVTIPARRSLELCEVEVWTPGTGTMGSAGSVHPNKVACVDNKVNHPDQNIEPAGGSWGSGGEGSNGYYGAERNDKTGVFDDCNLYDRDYNVDVYSRAPATASVQTGKGGCLRYNYVEVSEQCTLPAGATQPHCANCPDCNTEDWRTKPNFSPMVELITAASKAQTKYGGYGWSGANFWYPVFVTRRRQVFRKQCTMMDFSNTPQPVPHKCQQQVCGVTTAAGQSSHTQSCTACFQGLLQEETSSSANSSLAEVSADTDSHVEECKAECLAHACKGLGKPCLELPLIVDNCASACMKKLQEGLSVLQGDPE